MKLVPKLILYAIFITCLIFLFVDGPSTHSPRSYQKVWDLGHLLLFFIGGILILIDFRKYFKDNFLWHLLIVFIFTLVLGLFTELIQVRFHRDPDLGDLIRDIIGGFAAVLFFSPRSIDISGIWLRSLKFLLIVVILLEAYPFTRSLADEWIVSRQFPLLSDFETPFELDRWYHAMPLHLNQTIVSHGEQSMQVQLTTSKYSTFSLRYFPPDWSGYTNFHFSIFNSGSDTLIMTCRINDFRHYALGQNYNDRFNRLLFLAPGWNDYSIPVTDIVQAPVSRKMDIRKIDLICFFSTELAEPRIIYIDHLYLSK